MIIDKVDQDLLELVVLEDLTASNVNNSAKVCFL